MVRVLVADAMSEVGVQVLRDAGLEVDVKTGQTEDQLVELIKSYDALLVRSATKVTPRIMDAGDKLRLIGRAGVGVDNVDVVAASRHGIIVMNTPLGNINSAAEHAVALLLTMARNIPAADASMKRGEWEKKKFTGVEVRDKLLGIIGMGKIGQIVTRAATGMGMKVCTYDPFLPERRAREIGVTIVELDTLLRTADFVTVHTPLTKETKGLLDAAALAKMKKTARLVNCARGGIVVEEALAEALKNGKIAGAALDVFAEEPLAKDSPLRSVPNLILTPHLGASTEEAQTKVAEDVARQVAAFFKEGKIQNAVNLGVALTPEVEPFANVAETIGRLMNQMLPGRAHSMKCTVRGKIAAMDTHAVSMYALQGLLSTWGNQRVNLVNASLFAEELGIAVTEEKSADSADYSSMVRIEVATNGATHSAAGTVFEGREPRIIEIDGFAVDIKPMGSMLVMFYKDVPGMVGKFGTILGSAGINIAGMDVGRKEKRGRACVALTVDDPVPADVVKQIKSCTGEGGEAHLVTL